MYKVIDIIEPDFGCEGIPDGEEICCEVVLKSPQAEITVKIPDSELYRKNINIGATVSYNNDVILKVSD